MPFYGSTNRKIALIGGGEHARVCAESICKINSLTKVPDEIGYVDNLPQEPWKKSWLGDDSWFMQKYKDFSAIICCCERSENKRRYLIEKYKELSIDWMTIIDPDSRVSRGAKLGLGVYINVGAIINTGTRIGHHSIVNTGAVVDHDCDIGINVHVCPGVVMGGGVRIGDDTFVGLGVKIRDHVTIGKNVFIKMGSIVTRNVKDREIYDQRFERVKPWDSKKDDI